MSRTASTTIGSGMPAQEGRTGGHHQPAGRCRSRALVSGGGWVPGGRCEGWAPAGPPPRGRAARLQEPCSHVRGDDCRRKDDGHLGAEPPVAPMFTSARHDRLLWPARTPGRLRAGAHRIVVEPPRSRHPQPELRAERARGASPDRDARVTPRPWGSTRGPSHGPTPWPDAPPVHPACANPPNSVCRTNARAHVAANRGYRAASGSPSPDARSARGSGPRPGRGRGRRFARIGAEPARALPHLPLQSPMARRRCSVVIRADRCDGRG